MNSLSWLIYGAELFHSLSDFLLLCAFLCSVAALATFATARMGISDARFDRRYRQSDTEKSDTDEKLAFWEGVQKSWPLRLVKIAFLCAALSLPIPSSSTIYMIAASEMGEKVATSPETREMLSDLKTIVQKRLKALTGSEGSK